MQFAFRKKTNRSIKTLVKFAVGVEFAVVFFGGDFGRDVFCP